MEYVTYISLLVLSFIFGLFIKSFFPSYFNEKGKNLATKEDIKEITDKIESVRFEYLQKLEGVKSELTFIEKYKSKIKEKEIEILLSFFDKCAHLEEKLMFNFGSLTSTEKAYPVEYQKYIDNLFWEIRVSRMRLNLYLPTEHKLQTKADNLFGELSETRDVFNKHFGNYKIALVNELEGFLDFSKEKISEDELKKICETSDSAQKEYNDALNPVFDKFRVKFREFQADLQSYFIGVNKEISNNADLKRLSE